MLQRKSSWLFDHEQDVGGSDSPGKDDQKGVGPEMSSFQEARTDLGLFGPWWRLDVILSVWKAALGWGNGAWHYVIYA